MNPITLLDYAGVGLFAASGALAASRKELDIIGFAFLATLTGIGGGTVRDLILDVPVFWIEQHAYVLVCVGAAVAVFFSAPFFESRWKVILWLDALALAAYGVFGAYKGLIVTGSPVVAVVMAMITGTVGGILRDVIAREPSVLIRREIYVLAAMVAGLGFVLTLQIVNAPLLAIVVGVVLAFATRAGGLAFGWSLPGYKARPGRDPKDIPRRRTRGL